MRDSFGNRRENSGRVNYDPNFENAYGDNYGDGAQGEYVEGYEESYEGEYDPNYEGEYYEGGENYEGYEGEYDPNYDPNAYYEDGNGEYSEEYSEEGSDDMYIASDATYDDLDDDFTYLNNLADFGGEESFGSRRTPSSRTARNTSGRGGNVRSGGRYSQSSGKGGRRKKKRLTPGKVIGRIVIVLVTFLLITVGGLYMTIYLICKGPSPAAKNLFVSTIQETGQMKFVNKMFFTDEEITAITSRNSMGTLDAELDTDLIKLPGSTEGGEGYDESFDINGFEMVEITGRTFYAKMLIINDPSRVKLTTIYDGSWPEYGLCLDELVEGGNYLAGVNGGEYQSDSNKGGHPKGLVVCDGEIQYCNPSAGDVMIGFNNDNILIIRDIGTMSAEAVKSLVAELDIRDAVTFKDIADGDDNHFSKLIINGESLQLSGSGSGANPRTVIGQKEDGTVLLLVTDGRGAGGHLGATAADIISIMQEYGAVNAANLDGGSSSSMYVDGEYEMTSVTLYYANSSWRLPLAFVIERRD